MRRPLATVTENVVDFVSTIGKLQKQLLKLVTAEYVVRKPNWRR
jgi:hypothetical protein